MENKILVVDDEPQILILVSRFLQRLGYKVQTAGSGLIALEHLRDMPFALVLSDLKMPHMDGAQLLGQIKERYPNTTFILMTAFATIDSAISVLRQGAYDYLTKPLDLEDLRTTVQRAIEHRSVVMQNKRLMDFLREKNAVLEQLNREEQHKAEQLNRVNAIARQITAILDADELMTTVIELVKPAFDFEAFSFGIVRAEKILFRGGPLEGFSEHWQQSLFWELTDGGRIPFVRSRLDLSQIQVPYELVLPLCVGKRTIGLWVANWHKHAVYCEENLPYLEALIAQTVTALENARLYALARRADELAFLNEVGLAANQSLDLHITMESVLSCVRATFNALLVEICLWEDYQESHRAFRLIQGKFYQDSRSLFGQDFIGRICQEYRLLSGEASIERPRVEGTKDLTLRSIAGVALCLGEQKIGTLSVGSTMPQAYDREDVRLLQVVGGQVSTAIQNAQLFEEVESGRQFVLQSRNTLQALFDAILEGIYIVDRDNRVLAINQTQAKWIGVSLDELIGQPARQAFPASQCAISLIRKTFRTGEPSSSAERQRDPQGGWTEWEIQTYPVFASGKTIEDSKSDRAYRDNVDRVVVVVRDITEQRWLETSLARSEKLASIGRLAAGIAHEINNPMTVISANAQILREEIASTHPYYGSVELIDRASERASRIVRNLLDFSRAEDFEFVQTDLNLSLQEAVSLVEPQVRRSGTEISLELDDQLPRVWASPDHLHVVWLNLLLNARDAIQEVDRPGQIRLISRLRGDHAVVQVADNGIGIPSDEINRIYDPFFTTKPPGKGTGLGLFTCYRTIHRHGGEISVDSQVGEGTSFLVVLPISSISGQ